MYCSWQISQPTMMQETFIIILQRCSVTILESSSFVLHFVTNENKALLYNLLIFFELLSPIDLLVMWILE